MIKLHPVTAEYAALDKHVAAVRTGDADKIRRATRNYIRAVEARRNAEAQAS